MPVEIRRRAYDFRCVVRHAGKYENLGARSLQDRYMRVQMLIANVVGDIDPDHPGDVTEPVLQSLEKLPAEVIVLPKCNDLFPGIERLDVVGVDASLFAD